MNQVSLRQFETLVLSKKEIGLQTYEFLDGDRELRAKAKHDFLTGDDNPIVDYPLLDRVVIGQKASVLSDLQSVSARTLGMSIEAREAYDGTIDFRLREARMLLQLCDLNEPDISDAELSERAETYQQTNEQLYGRPEDELVWGMTAELQKMIDDKGSFTGWADEIFDELQTSYFDKFSNDAVSALPVLTQEAKTYLSDSIDDHFGIEKVVVDTMREELRAKGATSFKPVDLVELFNRVIAAKGFQGQISAFLGKGKLLAWSQEKAGVSVGEDRPEILLDDPLVYGLVTHEEGVHGQKYINGLASKISVLGNGLYVVGKPGQPIDYLAFEEGQASMYQNIAAQSETPWVMNNFRGTLNTALAYSGKDFRRTFALTWRLRALLSSKEGKVDESIVNPAQSDAYDDVLRVFRGTPMHRIAALGQLATYNKDLVYLKGKVSAVQHWNTHYGDDKMFHLMQSGKFDPTNTRQLAIAHAATDGRYQ